ncbi:DNA polymerase III subunit beta [Mycoplasmopsis columbina]|uniref:DNA polymerase III subunit beta n=1 Tax=Mycoplasmopsis columbina TaxID=114881 RepID=UPI0004A78112|nr:DNA polymerase III subunit beta [Mycoplasmopsis columbina]VEU76604.1 DNA polymerase III, beta subunit [Mycoplasmopsis columbina]
MKFLIDKKIFDETVEIVSRYTDPINTSYGLRCILFNVTNESIELSATNGYISIVKKIDVDNEKIKVFEEGQFLIQASLFKNIIKKSNKEITVSDEIGEIEISSGETKYTLSPNNINIFPGIEETYEPKKIEIDTNSFKKAIKSVSFAVSTEEHTFKCINFYFEDNLINITATDKYRLARYSLKVNSLFNSPFDISVLASSVKELIPNDAPKKVVLLFNNTKFGVEYKNTKIIARITDITYPRLDHLFNTEEIKNSIKIDKDIFVDLLNKAFVISGQGNKKVELNFSKNELRVSTYIQEIGTSLVKTSEIEFEGSKTLSFDVDYNFIKDALNVYSGEVILLTDDKPNKILILSKSNEECKQILSPIRR